MQLRRFLPIIIMFACSLPALAVSQVDVNEYVALRKKCSAASVKDAQANAACYIGKVIEIRGKVVGLLSRANGCSVILSTERDGSYVVDSDTLPDDNPGAELACLVNVGEGSQHSLSDLKLKAFTYEVFLKRKEEAWRQNAAAAEARKRAVRQPVSRSRTGSAARGTSQNGGKTMSVDEFIRVYRDAIKGFNKKLTDKQADTIARSVLGYSAQYKIDPRLVCAVILTESRFRIEATSHAGAQGLGQLMPGTAAGMGVKDSYDPVQNVYGCVRYIKGVLERITGKHEWNELTYEDLSLALAAYNAGPGAVKKHGGIPPYRETQNYVKRVISTYKQLCGGG
ncbi:MAG: lytic transglycosylase domain-containing protein [Armatimonadetes bacterium]|nr:lytic transglycosylase domain-containing protein [Armatimonadota bacterium]